MKLLCLFIVIIFSPVANSQDSLLICRSKASYAYHKKLCQGLSQCKSAIVKLPAEEARELRNKACGYCYKNSQPTKGNGYDAVANDGQCNATTKKGTRCSRNSRTGGYCWQHGG